jgi:hypothetical protein
MALTKEVIADKVEVVGVYRHVQVRTATVVEEDGVELSRSFHRHVVAPGEDTTGMDAEVIAICEAVHTPEIIAAYEASLLPEPEEDDDE